ncbi:MAG: site-specific integrase [Verrucomicrobiota bacterium]
MKENQPAAEQSPPSPAKRKDLPLLHVKDRRGNPVEGLWQRGNRFYLQIREPGKQCRRIPLLDENRQPVKSSQEAISAAQELRKKIFDGQSIPVASRAPLFPDYVEKYLSALQNGVKKAKTIAFERSILKGWSEYLGQIRLSQIQPKHVSDYVTLRKSGGSRRNGGGVGNRAVNLDVLVLSNILRYAKDEGLLSGKLPTEGFKRLKYIAPKRRLIPKEEIEKLCAEAVALKPDGEDKYRNGAMLRDAIRFMAYSGARVNSALATLWSDVDFERRQVHLRETKYDHKIVVDFNNDLEALLKDMVARRAPDSECLFPSPRADGRVSSLRKSFELVRAAAGVKIGFHDLRHYFASSCVMSGIDFATVATWLGHSDGGVLLGKVYSHLSDRHRKLSAAKVSFDAQKPVPAQPASKLVDISKLSVEGLVKLLQEAHSRDAKEEAA